MASNNAFTLSGATPNKTPIYPTPSGQPVTTPATSAPRVGVSSPQVLQQSGLMQNPTTPKLGTNPGLIKSTVDVQGNTTNYDTKPNPNVLAQQKALNLANKATPGYVPLVEDGILGPKTRSAVEKYGNGVTTPTPQATPKPTTPQVGSPVQNAQNVLNTGQQTPQENVATERLYQAGQMTPEEQKANEDVRIANEIQKAYENVNALAPYAEAKMYSDRARTPAEIQDLIQAPDLAGRASATQGLLGNLGNIYGSSRVAGATSALQGVQTAAQRGLGAAQSGLVGAQNQASRAQSGAGTVLTSGLLGTVSPGQVPFSPFTGEQGQLTGTQGGGLFGAGAIQGQIALGQQYPALVSAHTQAQGIENQISSYLAQNPQLNPSNVTDINKIAQWLLGGKLGDPKYQTLANYLQEYINTLAPILGVGGDVTNLKTEIAQSFISGAASGQSITEVLKNVDNLATQKLNAMRQTGQGAIAPAVSTSQSGGGSFAETW